MKKLIILLLCIVCLVGCRRQNAEVNIPVVEQQTVAPEMDNSDFVKITDVVPDVILEIRCYPTYTNLTDEQLALRQTLRDAMMDAGSKPFTTEWWHFTLADEPYPDTYFDFPLK